MHSFDFLSESPKLFIFQNDVNKTNLSQNGKVLNWKIK